MNSSSPVLDQMSVQGRYENIATNTAQLAGELSATQDVRQLITDFDGGFTPLRYVGNMFTAHRTAILEAYQAGTVGDIARAHPELLSGPVANLHQRVIDDDQDQPVGHNFFVSAAGFRDAGLPWAQQFDELIRTRTGVSLHDVVQSDDQPGKDRLLAAITENPDPESMTTLAVYLASRSLAGEQYLKQNYGEILEQARSQASETTANIAATTGLRADMLDRAAAQLKRATFGSFDHLQGLVTTDDSGAMGDYRIGSLRVEVHFEGNVRSAQLRNATETLPIVVHEVHHAGSAQVQENSRCGLYINGHGLEVNEGMTEYLAQLSQGSPGIEQLEDGTILIQKDVSFGAPVSAIHALHEQFKTRESNHFAVLFNAYHGDVRDKEQLEQALDTFYQLDSAISGRLSGSENSH